MHAALSYKSTPIAQYHSKYTMYMHVDIITPRTHAQQGQVIVCRCHCRHLKNGLIDSCRRNCEQNLASLSRKSINLSLICLPLNAGQDHNCYKSLVCGLQITPT